MEKHPRKLLSLLTLLLLATLALPQKALADDDDPPSRVARLSYARGSISFQPAGTDDWVTAVVNRPITTGDKLWADNDSRAELHIGSASIRMAANTGFSFLNLTDNLTQIQLTAGTVRIRVKRLDDNETFEVDTPNLAFSVLRPGVYKINVNEGGDATIIKVRGGEGEVTGGGSAFAVHPHEIGYFNGTDQLTADIQDLDNEEDGFDAWCADRDRHEDLAVSARYVSPDVIGYEDLDEYGGWRPVPEYGMVWFPRVSVVGWAPYRYGHWAYVAPWGYTWVDDAPWGFAPFHYGRWINYGGVWGWVPCPPPARGVVYVRPVYAPALVAWVGGPHFAVGVGVGGGFAAGVNVGWFPLAPREVYVPSYPVSRTYVTNVNVSNTVVNTTVVNNYYNTTIVNRNTTVVNNNVTVIHQTYVNQSVTGAVTATTPQAFTSAQAVSKNVVHVDQREVVSAQVNVFTPSVPPAKQAVLGTGAVATVRPPTVVQTRVVVAKTPPPPPPVSFARQQQAIQANGGRPLGISQVRQIQPQNAQAVHPNVKVAPQAAVPNPQAGGRGNSQNVGATGNAGFRPGNSGGNSNGNPPERGNNAYKSGESNGRANNGMGYNGNPNNRTPSNGTPGNGTANNGVPNNGTPNNGTANNATMNNAVQPKPGNGPDSNGNGNAGRRGLNDRPPSARPGENNAVVNTGGSNAALNTNSGDTGHQQQADQSHGRQEHDRQKFDQPPPQEHAKVVEKTPDNSRVQQLNPKSEPQAQNPNQQHDNQRQQAQLKQQDDRKGNSSKPSKPDKDNKDKDKKDKDPKHDK